MEAIRFRFWQRKNKKSKTLVHVCAGKCADTRGQRFVFKVFSAIYPWKPDSSYEWEDFHSETVKTSKASQIKPNVNNWVMPKGSLKKKIPKSKVMEGLIYWKKPNTFSGRRFAP